MGVSGQRHAPAAPYPRGKDRRYPLDRRLGGLRAGLDTEARGKILCLPGKLDLAVRNKRVQKTNYAMHD
jgi:hypothetical protein